MKILLTLTFMIFGVSNLFAAGYMDFGSVTRESLTKLDESDYNFLSSWNKIFNDEASFVFKENFNKFFNKIGSDYADKKITYKIDNTYADDKISAVDLFAMYAIIENKFRALDYRNRTVDPEIKKQVDAHDVFNRKLYKILAYTVFELHKAESGAFWNDANKLEKSDQEKVKTFTKTLVERALNRIFENTKWTSYGDYAEEFKKHNHELNFALSYSMLGLSYVNQEDYKEVYGEELSIPNLSPDGKTAYVLTADDMSVLQNYITNSVADEDDKDRYQAIFDSIPKELSPGDNDSALKVVGLIKLFTLAYKGDDMTRIKSDVYVKEDLYAVFSKIHGAFNEALLWFDQVDLPTDDPASTAILNAEDWNTLNGYANEGNANKDAYVAFLADIQPDFSDEENAKKVIGFIRSFETEVKSTTIADLMDNKPFRDPLKPIVSKIASEFPDTLTWFEDEELASPAALPDAAPTADGIIDVADVATGASKSFAERLAAQVRTDIVEFEDEQATASLKAAIKDADDLRALEGSVQNDFLNGVGQAVETAAKFGHKAADNMKEVLTYFKGLEQDVKDGSETVKVKTYKDWGFAWFTAGIPMVGEYTTVEAATKRCVDILRERDMSGGKKLIEILKYPHQYHGIFATVKTDKNKAGDELKKVFCGGMFGNRKVE